MLVDRDLAKEMGAMAASAAVALPSLTGVPQGLAKEVLGLVDRLAHGYPGVLGGVMLLRTRARVRLVRDIHCSHRPDVRRGRGFPQLVLAQRRDGGRRELSCLVAERRGWPTWRAGASR